MFKFPTPHVVKGYCYYYFFCGFLKTQKQKNKSRVFQKKLEVGLKETKFIGDQQFLEVHLNVEPLNINGDNDSVTKTGGRSFSYLPCQFSLASHSHSINYAWLTFNIN